MCVQYNFKCTSNRCAMSLKLVKLSSYSYFQHVSLDLIMKKVFLKHIEKRRRNNRFCMGYLVFIPNQDRFVFWNKYHSTLVLKLHMYPMSPINVSYHCKNINLKHKKKILNLRFKREYFKNSKILTFLFVYSLHYINVYVYIYIYN